MVRTIVHIHVPDFCAVMEELRDPSRSRKPLVVASPGKRAVVQSVNRRARREGLREGMLLSKALRRCPRLQVVPFDPFLYQRAHEDILQDLSRFSPLVEGTTWGRYFLDLSGTWRLWGAATDTVCRMEEEFFRHRSLRVHAGVAVNRLMSRVAAECVRMGEVGWVFPGSEKDFLSPLPVTFLPGVGPQAAARFRDLSIQTIGDLAELAPEHLVPVFGRSGWRFYRWARGEDSSLVLPFEKRSVLRFARDLPGEEIHPAVWDAFLLELVEESGWVFRRHNRVPCGGRLHVRYADGVEGRKTVRVPSWKIPIDRFLFHHLRRPFRDLLCRRVALRRIVLEWTDFRMPFRQLPLFPASKSSVERECRIQRALDRIRARYGTSAVEWGRRWEVISGGTGGKMRCSGCSTLSTP